MARTTTSLTGTEIKRGHAVPLSNQVPDVIEVALANIDKNIVRRSYNCSDYLEPRRAVMSWWSNYFE